MDEAALWMADQVLYQIVPDRFAIGKPHRLDSKLKLPVYGDPAYSLRRWDEMPENPSRGQDFFGGDLRGILDRLDHIQDLGATAIYLTPIFISPSNHKYDTTDFFTIDPQFGDEATLRELITEVHRRKMRLILDAVLNHVSESHPWLLAAQRHEKPYRDFFTWRTDGSYECWRDFTHLAELNLANRALQDLLFRNPDSVLQKYLALGIDGWRFDTGPDLGMPIMRAIRAVIGARFPEAVLIGEVMCYGADWCNREDAFHGVMNYYFQDAVHSWLRGEISGRQVNRAMKDYGQGYGAAGALRSWNMLSSHDTPRLRWMIHDAIQRRLAIVAQFTLPGVPFVYYGEEVGMEGGPDPDCRRPMIWDESRWDHDTLTFFKSIIKIRQSHAMLRRGQLTVLGDRLEADALVFLRHGERPEDIALVAINNATQPLQQRIFTPYSHLYHAMPLKNLLDPTQIVTMEAGNLRLDIPPRSAAIFVPDDTKFHNYKFFKPRNVENTFPI